MLTMTLMMKAALQQLCRVVMLVVIVTPRPSTVAGSGSLSRSLQGPGSGSAGGQPKLHQLGPCSCRVGSKVVDLSPLAFRNHTPRFHDEEAMYPYKFSWNPCYDFNESQCRGVAGCQVVVYPLRHYGLGSQSSATFLFSRDNELQIRYQAPPARGIRRALYVTLMCVTKEEGDKILVIGERRSEHGVYDLTLYSHHACPQTTSGGQAALSVGSIMLISVSVLLFAYLAVGVVFQAAARKQTGVHVIPNLALWVSLPGLVKDGFLFVKKRGNVGQMYQPVG